MLVALLFSDFLLLGLTVGAQGVLWAELLARLQLSKGAFGSAQLVTPVVAITLLLLGGALSSWAGAKRLAIASLLLMGAGSLALAGSTNLWTLVGALAVLGGGFGLFETAMNGAALDWEHATARHVLNTLHAGYSAGAVAGAIGAGVLVGMGWPPAWVLTLVGGLCAAGAAATLPVRYPQAIRPPPGSPPGGPGTVGALTLFRRNGALATLALVCMLGSVGESVANIWSVIYLHEQGAGALLGGATFALTNAAMLVGRLGNAPLVRRFGTRASLRSSGAGLVLATALLLLPAALPPGISGGLPGAVPLAVGAFALLGLAVAGVVPTTLSAGARLAPGNNAAVAGGMLAAVYVSFAVCPPLIGWLADLVSLPVALLVVGLSGLAILVVVAGITDPPAGS